jgi:hypothetical protein
VRSGGRTPTLRDLAAQPTVRGRSEAGVGIDPTALALEIAKTFDAELDCARK